MKHNKRAQRLLGGAVLHSPAGGLGRLEAFAKEAPALMTDESGRRHGGAAPPRKPTTNG